MRAHRRHHAQRVKNRLRRRHFSVWRESVEKPLPRLLKLVPLWPPTEPKWWRHASTLKPARAVTQRLLVDIHKGADPDLADWPDYRKPQAYYW